MGAYKQNQLQPAAPVAALHACFSALLPRLCSELGGVYSDCNLLLGLGRRERKSQVRRAGGRAGGRAGALCAAPSCMGNRQHTAQSSLPHSKPHSPAKALTPVLPLPRVPPRQALYPWRRVLREMFHHDRQLGQVYCLRGTDPVVVSWARLEGP